MLNLRTCGADLSAIAIAYKKQRQAGAVDYSAFAAAIIAYQTRHPNKSRTEAALVVSQLISKMTRKPGTLH